MQPAHPQLAENVVPIEITGLELARRRVAAVGDPDRAAHAKTALGEIQTVARDATDTIERHPFDEFRVHPALQNEIFEQMSHLVVGKGGADSGF